MSTNPGFHWITDLVSNELSSEDENILSKSDPDDLAGYWKYVSTRLDIGMDKLAETIADHYTLSLAKLPENKLDLETFPDSVLAKYSVIALNEDKQTLLFATANPFDQEVLSILGFLSDKHIEFAVASPDAIDEWFKNKFSHTQVMEIKNTSEHINNSVITRLVNKLINQALEQRASDIHIEPANSAGIVRYRIDGILHKITSFPIPVFRHVTKCIKALARMDIANNLIPQDGQIHIDNDIDSLDLRVSSMPVKGGEKFVIRLLQQKAIAALNDLNIPERELQQIRELIHRPKGIFIMSGPTGSGKTTTLNSAISEINTVDKCIITVEDPVEYEIDGIAQINVNPAQGLTFNKALRHILRQDPDAILVGEIRDSETAETAIRSALTGHLVLTTLHTNNAVTVISRLKDLGISNALMSDSLNGLAAQRLVRKLCSYCAESVNSAVSEAEQLFLKTHKSLPAKRATGCKHCNNSGYKGRIPLIQILMIDDNFIDAIRSDTTSKELSAIAKQKGMRTLTEVAVEQILAGNSTTDEIYRVLGHELWNT